MSRFIEAELIFIAVADLKFEIPEDTPDAEVEGVLSEIMETIDPVEKLGEHPELEFVRWIGLQSMNPPVAIMPRDEIPADDLVESRA